MADLILSDCLTAMAGMEPDSVDAIVTDPPYGLGFMGKRWDAMPPGDEVATAALRVLKPAHYLVAFGGTRTHHRLMVALEDAGFEIRDCLMWLYGSGFPKGKGQLKPAYEPIILCRKPGKGVRALGIDECRIGTEDMSAQWDRTWNDNTGPMGSRYPQSGRVCKTVPPGRWPANVVIDEEAGRLIDEQSGVTASTVHSRGGGKGETSAYGVFGSNLPMVRGVTDSGGASRFYFKVESDEWQSANTAEQSSYPPNHHGGSAPNGAATSEAHADALRQAGLPVTAACIGNCNACSPSPNPALCAALRANTAIILTTPNPLRSCGCVPDATDENTSWDERGRVAVDSAQESLTRFLYSPKASRSERNAGCEGLEAKISGMSNGAQLHGEGYGKGQDIGLNRVIARQNHHPTVKPVALMRWLVRLIAPPGGTVLDPFMGSGTTGVAAVQEGRFFVGIEREPEYHRIAQARIAHAEKQQLQLVV